MTEHRPKRASRWVRTAGRGLVRALTVALAIGKPAEQFNGYVLPPEIPPQRPDEYRP